MKNGRYRRIFINDKLERLHSEYVWQLCDAGAQRVLDLENHFVFVNLRCGQWLAPLRPETVHDPAASLKDGWAPRCRRAGRRTGSGIRMPRPCK